MPTIRAAWGALAALAAAGTAALTLPIPDPGHAADLPIAATSVIDGHAATWAPCRDIGYNLNTAAAPPGAAADTAAVLADLSRATGLTFTSRGATSRTPQPGTAPIGPADPDAPLTIAWAHRPGPGAGRPVSALLDASGDVAGKTVIVDAYRPRRGIIPRCTASSPRRRPRRRPDQRRPRARLGRTQRTARLPRARARPRRRPRSHRRPRQRARARPRPRLLRALPRRGRRRPARPRRPGRPLLSPRPCPRGT